MYLCGVRGNTCSYRGATYVLDADGRRHECQKVGLAEPK